MSQAENCLNAHNAYRAKHGVPPLLLNQKVSAFSQSWADNLIRRNAFEHSKGSGYGENIYYYQNSDPNYSLNGKEAVDSWYDEIKLYNFNRQGFSSGTGHFTQVVWKESKELGFGIAKSGGKTIVVCNYSPPGNFMGQFEANVFPPQ